MSNSREPASVDFVLVPEGVSVSRALLLISRNTAREPGSRHGGRQNPILSESLIRMSGALDGFTGMFADTSHQNADCIVAIGAKLVLVGFVGCRCCLFHDLVRAFRKRIVPTRACTGTERPTVN
jgi:hypothetical protein